MKKIYSQPQTSLVCINGQAIQVGAFGDGGSGAGGTDHSNPGAPARRVGTLRTIGSLNSIGSVRSIGTVK